MCEALCDKYGIFHLYHLDHIMHRDAYFNCIHLNNNMWCNTPTNGNIVIFRSLHQTVNKPIYRLFNSRATNKYVSVRSQSIGSYEEKNQRSIALGFIFTFKVGGQAGLVLQRKN